jgi:hypothetical protein
MDAERHWKEFNYSILLDIKDKHVPDSVNGCFIALAAASQRFRTHKNNSFAKTNSNRGTLSASLKGGK